MTVVIGFVVMFALFLFVLDRRDKRERAERTELLNRIQAPELTIGETFDVGARHVPFDDDDALNEALNG